MILISVCYACNECDRRVRCLFSQYRESFSKFPRAFHSHEQKWTVPQLCRNPSSPCLPHAGKLKAYDSDGDGDFDVEDAKVLLGKYFLLTSLLSSAVFSPKNPDWWGWQWKTLFNGWWSVAEHNRPEWSRQGVEPKQTSVLKVCSARQLCLTAEGHKRSQQWSLNSWLLS